MNYADREKIEWGNYWIESANIPLHKRCLLIGDSVARSIRPTLNQLLIDVDVDYLGTSAAVVDELFLRQIDFFFSLSEYSYEFCIINISFHHGLNKRIVDSSCYMEEFVCAYSRFLTKVELIIPTVYIVSGTPEMINEDLAQLNNNVNKEIVARNNCIKRICDKNGYHFIDIYSWMESGIEHIFYNDYVHFDQKTISRVCNRIVSEIKGRIGIDWDERNKCIEFCDNIMDFEKFISTRRNIYIWGAGDYGRIIAKYIQLRSGIFSGFVVSDKENIMDRHNIEFVSNRLYEMRQGIVIIGMKYIPVDIIDVLRQERIKGYHCSIDIVNFFRNFVKLNSV